MVLLTGQSGCVLTSWYTSWVPEQGFWCCFVDRFSQKLISVCSADYVHPDKRCEEWGINKNWIASTPITQLCAYRCWPHATTKTQLTSGTVISTIDGCFSNVFFTSIKIWKDNRRKDVGKTPVIITEALGACTVIKNNVCIIGFYSTVILRLAWCRKILSSHIAVDALFFRKENYKLLVSSLGHIFLLFPKKVARGQTQNSQRKSSASSPKWQPCWYRVK